MAHGQILGPTECGKSTLARQLAARARREGRKTMAWARRDIDRWQASVDFVTSSRERFLEVLKKSKGLVVFIDDAGGSIDRYDMDLIATATEGRHDGHSFYFLAHYATMLPKGIRRNCTILYAFKQADDEADLLAREYAQPLLKNCARLEQYEYLHCRTFGPVYKGGTKP